MSQENIEINANKLTTPESRSVRLFALDGIGGCGKSHTGKLIAGQITESGLSVVTPKIAGLGDSLRVQKLKEIKGYRYEAIKNGTAPQKYIEDQEKDKIFRMAIRHQVNEFNKLSKSASFDVAIIDRTPLMSWVFASASNPENPYLPEIFEESMKTTEKLGLSKVYLLDIAPEIAYARMIARYCAGRDDAEVQIDKACNTIQANESQVVIIKENALNQLSNFEGLQSKPFESWDLIPILVAERERDLHKEALRMANQRFGLQYQIIDAEQPLDLVVSTIQNSINTNLK